MCPLLCGGMLLFVCGCNCLNCIGVSVCLDVCVVFMFGYKFIRVNLLLFVLFLSVNGVCCLVCIV